MSLNRYRVIWTGGPGGEGVSTFYGDEITTTGIADVRAFFLAVAPFFPDVLSWTFPSSGDTIDLATGQIDGAWSEAPVAGFTGSGSSSSWAAGVGARVRWETANVLNGRRVRGATFLTSLTSNCYASDGTLAPAVVTAFQAAADDLVAAGWLGIYSRNFGPGGSFSEVTSATIPDRVSWLRTRRL